MEKIRSSEITPEHVYLSRRRFMRLGALALGSMALAGCGGQLGDVVSQRAAGDAPRPQAADAEKAPAAAEVKRDELGDPANSFETISTYNNYYEFTEDKEGVARLAANFKAEPWKVTVGGLVSNPRTYDVDDLRRNFDQEERIYRLRCVEGWSMVIPWLGFPLAKLLREVQPKAEAKYVRFESLLDPAQYPNQGPLSLYPWPYTEGLRLDEAMHDLTLMVTGLYGKPLPNSNGAPLRLAVPWKYGFKSIKAIVKIELVAEQPKTLWSTLAPHEYGFYSNVNPQRPHPRWSQATERRIGEPGRRPTLMFNGYEKQVADLYAGMNLQINY
jgi:sulfoxide reductase catalytic subunit YedY